MPKYDFHDETTLQLCFKSSHVIMWSKFSYLIRHDYDYKNRYNMITRYKIHFPSPIKFWPMSILVIYINYINS
jgi:hypothetical protein